MALDSIDSVRMALTVSGNASKNITGFQNPVSGAIGEAPSTAFALGTGASQCNELISVLRTIAASGTDNLDLTTLADICNVSPIVLASIVAMLIEVPSVAQDPTNGTAASGIKIGAAASNPWTGGPLGATDTFLIRNGERFAQWTETASGWTVSGSSKVLKVVNQDGAVAVNYRITLFGRG